ncbi:SWIM zinc finger family protein [Streptomyces sp. CL12]|uniref:SWIM zinc finger family protein n=1 Tax=Streptomyces sp. CL12 TaxID=3391744 RepID=UPI003A80E219
MTPTDPTRPADLAREALRAARRRSQALPGAERAEKRVAAEGSAVAEEAQGADAGFGGEREAEEAADLGHHSAPGRDSGSGRHTGRARDTEPGRESAPGRDLDLGSGPAPGRDPDSGRNFDLDREADSDRDPDLGREPRPDRDPAHGRVAELRPNPGPGPDAGARPASESTPRPRPGDIAREALRAARREALRVEAEAAAEAERGGRRKPGRSKGVGAEARAEAAQGMSSSGRSGEHDPSRAARLKVAGEMRQFLKNAFRMPPEADAEPADDPAPTRPEHEHGYEHQTEFAVPHAPPTMATPHRDGEHRRTFPAFAPRGERAEDGAFAGTWWGNAWVQALERGALDAKRVARGRGYADQGHVDAITVTPGSVLAYVRGSRPRPYRVQVRVRPLADAEWERFLDTAAGRPGHIAALLDKELPHSLADCGIPLLPGPGDLAPRCSCPDSGHPCKHAAALCYQTARLLDADPFVLLLLRGRGERELLDALSRRSAARAARDGRDRRPSSLPGIRATEALAPRDRPPLPPPAPVPAHPEQPPAYPAAPGGPDPFALDQLATDAAARAHALLGTGRDPVGELSLWQDAVRLAAARPGSGLTVTTRALYATLAQATDRTPGDLARAVAAWRQGGVEGLAVLEEPWDPPAGRFDRARPLLLAADLPAFRPWRNRLTHPLGQVQLRLGRDGLWYVYESEPGEEDWWPRGTPDLDPVGALTGLGAPDGT